MPRSHRSISILALAAVAAWLAAPRDAGADDRKLFVGFREVPYVFIILDNSSSMAWVTECSQEDLDNGFCRQICDQDDGGCMAPLNADDPAAKLYEAKEILYQILLETENVDFGFATFNQDDMHVRAKHWMYRATGDGPTIPNSSPARPYPRIGDADVFGRQWSCNSGFDIGCSAADAALLTDDYELERVQRLSKGGIDFDSTTTFYVNDAGTLHKVVYGDPTGNPGDATVDVTVTVWRCTSPNSDSTCNQDETSATVTFERVGEFISYDLQQDTPGASDESLGLEVFFEEFDAADVLAHTGTTNNGVGRCGGLDMNDDTPDDIYEDPYNLRFPTVPDADTPLLDIGDFVPWDWADDHKNLILSRLAPNRLLGEATPDFSIARYFEDAGSGPNGALELLDPNVRPVLPASKTPLDAAIADFREWYDGCRHNPNCPNAANGFEEYAATRDPNWSCRSKYVLIISDGDESCGGGNACMATANMNSQLGVETFVIGYGVDPEGDGGGGQQSTLTCLPANSGAGDGQEIGALFPHNRQELLDALKTIFDAITGRTATFSAAAVPTVQADAADKLFLTSLTPVNGESVWPGELDGFLKPLPLDADNLPDDGGGAPCPDPSNDASGCHLWDAATVMLDTQVNVADPVGPGAGQRRVFYSRHPTGDGVPRSRETFENSTNSGAPIEVERDLWRGLGVEFVAGDNDSEDAARIVADAIVDDTLAIKTGTLPDNATIDYLLGDIFHSDPLIMGSPTNNNYFIADAGADADPATACDSGDPGYRCYFFKHQKRRKVLAAGSNDGQVHFFDAGAWRTSGPFDDRFDNGSGKEILAYMPRPAMPVVKRMTEDPPFPQYAVDGRPTAADVFIDPLHDGSPSPDEREWRTVLMGGLREGGWTTTAGFSDLEGPFGSETQLAAGYYLIDATQPDPVDPTDPAFLPDIQDPPACLEAGVADCGTLPYGAPLWEFTDTIPGLWDEDGDGNGDRPVGVRLDEDANGAIDLAPTWSIPNIGRIRVCAADGVDPAECNPAVPDNDVEDRYVAIFGGGLDQRAFHERGNFLYIVDIESGKTIYKRRLFGSAPSEPAAVDTNFDGYLDTIYIGTTLGFLYRADLAPLVGSDVVVPQLAEVTVSGVMSDGTVVNATEQRIVDDMFAPYILFNANDVSVQEVILGVAAGTLDPQQIYFRPSVIFVPDLDRYALTFGTGNRADLFDRGEQGGRFFTFVDDVTGDELRDEPADVPPVGVPINPVDLELIDLADNTQRTDNLLLTVGGWRINLAENQRVVTETFALTGVLFFSSFIPDPTSQVDPDPQPNETVFCREAGTSQIFAALATNANGLLFVSGSSDPVRFREVEDLATRPYTEVSQTGNPTPENAPPPLTEELFKIQEGLKELFPPNCSFPPGFHIDVKTRVTDTGIEFIAPVPICVIEKNFKDF